MKDPVIFICLLGRVLWMNQTYIKVNLQSEDDLFETLNGKFGFEVFEEAFQLIQKNVPETFEYSSIEFVSFLMIKIRLDMISGMELHLHTLLDSKSLFKFQTPF